MTLVTAQKQQRNWSESKQHINMQGLLRLVAVVMFSGTALLRNSLKWNINLNLDSFLEGAD